MGRAPQKVHCKLKVCCPALQHVASQGSVPRRSQERHPLKELPQVENYL